MPRGVRGFTLLELMLVLLLLSSLALVTTLFVDSADDQVRFEQTKSRLEQIRRAIVGDTSRTLNGEPVISGFVADMGRLPANLSELIEPTDSMFAWESRDMQSISGVTGLTGTLHGGWRGPYIDSIQESDVAGVSGVRATLRDGWGNRSKKEIENDEKDDNFGWLFYLKKNESPNEVEEDTPPTIDPLLAKSLILQSLGSDNEKNDSSVAPENSNDTYRADYPPEGYKVALNDWALPDLSVIVRLSKEPAIPPPGNLELRIYYLPGDEPAPKYFKSDLFGISGVQSDVMPIKNSDGSTLSLVPMGTYAAVVVCSGGQVYDGNCPSSSTHAPYYFKLIPRAFTPPLIVDWTVQ